MWERFTERAKHVVSAAREEATRLGSEYVRTEHILLGLCRETEGIAARALENLGVDTEALALEIEQQVQLGSAVVSSDDIAFTPRAKKVLELAVEEARRFNHSYIGTEHILLGVGEGSGVAANVLKNLHVDLRVIRVEVEKMVVLGSGATKGSLPLTPRGKRVIEYAVAAARELNHNHIGSEHLLLGLLREKEGIAAQVLVSLGVTKTTPEILSLLGPGLPAVPQETTIEGSRHRPGPRRRVVAVVGFLVVASAVAVILVFRFFGL